MTESDKQLLVEYNDGIVPETVFLKRFSVDIRSSTSFVESAIRTAIETGNQEEIEMTISLIWLTGNTSGFLGLLNELLILPNHQSHQRIARTLQEIASPSTIPFVQRALETNFDYLEYTCSESRAIAKWFSWLLYAIGTKEAIDLIEIYSHSVDDGVKSEMRYRLNKVKK